MTKGNGLPCKVCGTSEWTPGGNCKQCARDHSNRWRMNNLDKAKERGRLWRQNNPERANEADRRKRQANPDKYREIAQRYVQNNPDKRRESANNYHRKNKDREAEYAKRWVASNPDRKREANRRWRENNPAGAAARDHRRRTRKSQAGGSYTPGEWKALCAQYDNHCCYPGCERTDLHADHVIPVSKGGSSNIDNMQPLCEYHNKSKANKIIDYRRKPGIVSWIQRKLFG